MSAWIRAAPPPELDPNDLLGDILYESCREFEDEAGGKKTRMQFCLREEATHLSLSGICGAIAPIAECEVVGKVDWPAELLNCQRESALRLGVGHTMLV